MDRRRHANHRLSVFFDRIDNAGGRAIWTGDKEGEEYHYPICHSAPYDREEVLKGKGRMEILESGGGLAHSCQMMKIPGELPMKAFLEKGRDKVRWTTRGYSVTIRIYVGGMVDQNPGGKWEWVGHKTADLPVPAGFHSIFGKNFHIDGWFRISGEPVSRRKRRTVEFRERQPGLLLDSVPSTTRMKVEWEDWLIPAPCFGITIWLFCAEVVDWKIGE